MKVTSSRTLLSLLFLTTTSTFSFASLNAKLYSYVGSFRFPGITDEKKCPVVPVYYKGAVVKVQENGYILTDSKKHSDFLMVISLLQAPTANTIARFEVPYGQKYLTCTLRREPVQKQFSKPDAFEETWKLTHSIQDGPYLVPEDSLVILMDPTCIDTLSRPIWSKEGNFVKLPAITFKKGCQESATFNRSLLASLDVAPFHKKDDIVSQSSKKSTSSIRKS